MQKLIVMLLMGFVALFNLVGCAQKQVPTPPPANSSSASSPQELMQQVQNNPNLPPEKKEQILRDLQQSQAARSDARSIQRTTP